jgi:hypothetical protein
MFDTLKPTSLIPYQNDTRNIEPVHKPAVIIPIKTEVKAIAPLKKKALTPHPDSPFCEWNMPAQLEGYIKCGKFDFL